MSGCQGVVPVVHIVRGSSDDLWRGRSSPPSRGGGRTATGPGRYQQNENRDDPPAVDTPLYGVV